MTNGGLFIQSTDRYLILCTRRKQHNQVQLERIFRLANESGNISRDINLYKKNNQIYII